MGGDKHSRVLAPTIRARRGVWPLDAFTLQERERLVSEWKKLSSAKFLIEKSYPIPRSCSRCYSAPCRGHEPVVSLATAMMRVQVVFSRKTTVTTSCETSLLSWRCTHSLFEKPLFSKQLLAQVTALCVQPVRKATFLEQATSIENTTYFDKCNFSLRCASSRAALLSQAFGKSPHLAEKTSCEKPLLASCEKPLFTKRNFSR